MCTMKQFKILVLVILITQCGFCISDRVIFPDDDGDQIESRYGYGGPQRYIL